jgi:hypothetical protein
MVLKGKQSISPWKTGFPHMSRRMGEATSTPKVGGSNPSGRALSNFLMDMGLGDADSRGIFLIFCDHEEGKFVGIDIAERQEVYCRPTRKRSWENQGEKKMKKSKMLIAVMVFVLLSFNLSAFAWDPVGTWKNEGRTDATMKIFKDGDLYRISFQSAYSKYEAVGTLTKDKLLFVITVTSDPQSYFLTFNRLNDNRMEAVTRDPDTGKEVWRGVLIR